MKLFTSTLVGLTSSTVVAGSAAQAYYSKSFQLVIAHVLQNAEIAHTLDAVNAAFWLILALAPLAIMAVMLLVPQLMDVPSHGLLGSIKREDFVDASNSLSAPARSGNGKTQVSLQSDRKARANGKLGMTAQRTVRPTPIMFRSAPAA